MTSGHPAQAVRKFRLRKAEDGIREVTPELAALWLEGNFHNRRLNESRVAEYVQKMLTGGWKERCGPPIELLDDGGLWNGQHRLTAVVRAGLSVRMRVVVYEKVTVQG